MEMKAKKHVCTLQLAVFIFVAIISAVNSYSISAQMPENSISTKSSESVAGAAVSITVSSALETSSLAASGITVTISGNAAISSISAATSSSILASTPAPQTASSSSTSAEIKVSSTSASLQNQSSLSEKVPVTTPAQVSPSSSSTTTSSPVIPSKSISASERIPSASAEVSSAPEKSLIPKSSSSVAAALAVASSSSSYTVGLRVLPEGTVFINADGSRFVGEKYIEGKGYAYFNPANSGLMVIGWYLLPDGRYVYYKDGYMVYGVQTINNRVYYFSNESGALRYGEFYDSQRGWFYVSPTTHEYVIGFYKLPDGRYVYYKDGYMVYGLQTLSDGYTYYFNPEGGAMYRGEKYFPNKGWSYFDINTGRMAIGFTILPDGRNVYYKDGYLIYGLVTIDNQWYWYDQGDGHLLESNVVVPCVDVSSYQGLIDWTKVKQSGTEYAILRALTWSRTVPAPDGSIGWYTPDAYFDYNMRAAKAAGLKVGAYIYTYAFNQQEVQAEVNEFLKVMAPLTNAGYRLDLPVFVDQEYNPLLTAVPDINVRTDLIRQEMNLLRNNGYYPGFYTYTNWAQNNINASQLQKEGYDFWVADYRPGLGYQGPLPVVGWQYSSTAVVPGINGDVDKNYWYKDYSGIINGSNNVGSSTDGALFTVYDLNSNTVQRNTMSNLLTAITANEVDGRGLTDIQQATQLYSAQAVAAKSWLLASMRVNSNPPFVGLANESHLNYSAIQVAIAPVLKNYVSYGGAVALTAYGSSGNGIVTNSSSNYFGVDIPYLRSVASHDYNTAKYYMGKTLDRTEAQVKADLVALVGGDFSNGIAPQDWIKILSRDINSSGGLSNRGYVTKIQVWGKEVSVADFYENVWGMTSPDFTFTYNNGIFRFISYGNGSGVGMSQFGAIELAKQKWAWQDILKYYYPGTAIGKM